MPKHKPIKFESSLEPNLVKQIKEMVQENKKAKTVLNATLALIAVGGVLTFGVMAPGAFGELTRFLYGKKKERHKQYQEIWQRFNYLKQRGSLEFVKEGDEYLIYRLSQKGKEKIRKLVIDELKLAQPKSWDNKWRLVIFDIPEPRRKARDAMRNKLKDLEFCQCQKSAWIHPFPCLEEIEFLKSVFNIKPFVKIFLIEEMTDGKVLYHFRNQIKKVVVK